MGPRPHPGAVPLARDAVRGYDDRGAAPVEPVTDTAFLLAVVALAWLASRRLDVAAMAAGACLLAASAAGIASPPVPAILAAAGAGALVPSTIVAARGGVFRLERRGELKAWRLAARPFAFLFVPLELLWGRRALLSVAGVVCLVFVGLDVYRYVSRRRLAAMYKEKEARRFSSMTYFLLGLFLVFLVIPDRLAWLPLAFATVGDLCGKLLGMRFGATPLYRGRTLQGTAAFTAGSLLAGWLVARRAGLPPAMVVAGAPFAALVELFSHLLDDNFSILVLSGAFLLALRYFFAL